MRAAPQIAALGFTCWNEMVLVDRFPAPGENAIVRAETTQLGGTTANSAVALARLGAYVSIASMVGDDAAGEAARVALASAGVDTAWVQTRSGERTDRSTIIVSHEPPERTLFWHQGAHLVRGDQLDIPAIFAHDLVLLDVADPPLRRFLLDLPAHTAPRTQLLGPLGHLVPMGADALDLAFRHDVVVGNTRELMLIVNETSLDVALDALQQQMRGANLRAAAITRAEQGCIVITPSERWVGPAFPVTVVDPTGAGDAFAAGVAYGVTQHWDWPRTARFANAVGALATRALGPQASLPTLAEVESFSAAHPVTLEA